MVGGKKKKISFIKHVETTNRKADTIYFVLSNKIAKCGRVKSLSRYGSDGASVINGRKKVASKLKRDNPKIISIHCHNYRLDLAILPFFKESKFLVKNYNYLIC